MVIHFPPENKLSTLLLLELLLRAVRKCKTIRKQKTTAWTNRFEHGRGASQASPLLLFSTRKITTTKIW